MTARTLPKPTVHAPGVRRLDAVLDFVAFVAKPMPLSTLLDGTPGRPLKASRQRAAMRRAGRPSIRACSNRKGSEDGASGKRMPR